MHKYVVFGASPNKLRHSNKAVKSLIRHNRDVVPVGFRNGNIDGVEIITGTPEIQDIDTLLLYLGPQRQKEYYNYLISLKPQRIVFNPGTENKEFQDMVRNNDIEVVLGCGLVMINGGQL